MKIILVAGGRNFKDQGFVWHKLDEARAGLGDFVTLTGSCPTGVDFFAETWAKAHEMPYIGYPAKWHEKGRGAGPIRNKEMLRSNFVDYGIIFPGGSGTRHMRSLLVAANIGIWQVDNFPSA